MKGLRSLVLSAVFALALIGCGGSSGGGGGGGASDPSGEFPSFNSGGAPVLLDRVYNSDNTVNVKGANIDLVCFGEDGDQCRTTFYDGDLTSRFSSYRTELRNDGFDCYDYSDSNPEVGYYTGYWCEKYIFSGDYWLAMESYYVPSKDMSLISWDKIYP